MTEIKSVVQRVFLYLLIASLLSSPILSLAQKPAQKLSFTSVNEVGLLTGAKGESVTVQTINGVKKGKSSAGVGVGLDFYSFKTIPLFVDVRRDFSASRNTAFAYVDAGINFLSLTDAQKNQLSSASKSSGLYYDLGVGWKLAGKNNRAFIVSAGYSLKQAKYTVQNYFAAPTPQLQSQDNDRYNYLFRRISIKLGFQL